MALEKESAKKRREYYIKNRERLNANTLRWRKKNIEKYRAWERQYKKAYEASKKRLEAKTKEDRCNSCDCLVDKNQVYCEWCVQTYPHLNAKSSL